MLVKKTMLAPKLFGLNSLGPDVCPVFGMRAIAPTEGDRSKSWGPVFALLKVIISGTP